MSGLPSTYSHRCASACRCDSLQSAVGKCRARRALSMLPFCSVRTDPPSSAENRDCDKPVRSRIAEIAGVDSGGSGIRFSIGLELEPLGGRDDVCARPCGGRGVRTSGGKTKGLSSTPGVTCSPVTPASRQRSRRHSPSTRCHVISAADGQSGRGALCLLSSGTAAIDGIPRQRASGRAAPRLAACWHPASSAILRCVALRRIHADG
jgi:hypothetical protein